MATSQMFPEFVQNVRKFILINSDLKPIHTRAAGISITVPGRTEVVEIDPNNPTGMHSARDVDGSYIPGTMELKDVYQQDMEGTEKLSVDATVMVKHLMGVTRQGVATSVLSRRGLSLLPQNSTRSSLERIRKEGFARSERWRIEQAQILVRELDSANAKREAKKLPTITPDEDYTHAILLLRAARTRDEKRLATMLERPDLDPETYEDVKQEIPLTEIESNDALIEMLREKALQVLPKEHKPDDLQTLVNKVINDPKAMKLMRSQFEMRRHKHSKKRLETQEPAPEPTPQHFDSVEGLTQAPQDPLHVEEPRDPDDAIIEGPAEAPKEAGRLVGRHNVTSREEYIERAREGQAKPESVIPPEEKAFLRGQADPSKTGGVIENL